MTNPILIDLKLTLDEVNALLNVLGELPTKTGAWPLIVKIREQAAPQVPVQDPVPPNVA